MDVSAPTGILIWVSLRKTGRDEETMQLHHTAHSPDNAGIGEDCSRGRTRTNFIFRSVWKRTDFEFTRPLHWVRMSPPSPSPQQRQCCRRQTVDLTDRFAMRDWSLILNTTVEKLLEAIREVGQNADEVREYLRTHE